MDGTNGRCPVVHFDHNSDEHSADPVGSLPRAAREGPVAWTEAHGGYWVLSGYQAVFEAARDDDDLLLGALDQYGGEGLSVVIPKTPMHLHIPIEIDPPDFRKWRKLINPITAPAAVERMKGMIEHYVTWFIDQVIEAGECDMTPGHRGPVDRHRRLAGPAVEDWQRYASAHHATLADPTGQRGVPAGGRGRLPVPQRADPGGHRAPAARTRRTTSSATSSSRRSTTGRSPTTRCSRSSTCCSPAASARPRRWSARRWSGSTSTRTSASSSSTTRRCWTRRSRSSCATSPPPRRWPGRSSRTPSSSAAR